jgi:hypothetical protein
VTGSPEALAGSYRASFFIGVGMADSAALFGLVGVFIGGSLWIYLLGLAFGSSGCGRRRPLDWTTNDGNARSRQLDPRYRFWMPSLPFHRNKDACRSERPLRCRCVAKQTPKDASEAPRPVLNRTPDRLRGGQDAPGGAGRDVAGGGTISARRAGGLAVGCDSLPGLRRPKSPRSIH